MKNFKHARCWADMIVAWIDNCKEWEDWRKEDGEEPYTAIPWRLGAAFAMRVVRVADKALKSKKVNLETSGENFVWGDFDTELHSIVQALGR